MEFSKDVCEKLKYYVYRLVDPRNGNTFYVGKGCGNRVFDHVKCALKASDNEDELTLKYKVIKEIENAGLKVIHIIHRYGMEENEAFEVESALMDCYAGLTNLLSGHASERGVNNVETIQNILSTEEFDDDNDLKYCVIKITQWGLDLWGGANYETTRQAWKVDLNRAQKLDYAISSFNGIVQEVYEIEEWQESMKFPGRKEFSGKVASDSIRNKFVGKRLPARYCKKGQANPVLYHDGK